MADDDDKIAETHMIKRTSGTREEENETGYCVLCGIENLLIVEAVKLPCANPKRIRVGEARTILFKAPRRRPQ